MARDLCVVGIDVGKAELVVSSYGDRPAPQAFRQDEASIAKLVEDLGRSAVRLVALESTGGYERRLLSALHAAGIPVSVLQPEKVKAFALSQGRRAKTDVIDCETIARFASVSDVRSWVPKSANLEAVKVALRRRDALIRERTREKNRLQIAGDDFVHRSIKEHIKHLNQQAAALGKRATELLKICPKGAVLRELLMSVPGVGTFTAARLMVELPELGLISKEALSSLAGLAPMNRDSGQSEGKRHCAPGRREVRTAMFQAAHSAVMFNPVIQDFFVRLMKKGKERKVALIACAHKLLNILNTMVRRNEKWDESRHSKTLDRLPEGQAEELAAEIAQYEVEPAQSGASAEQPGASVPQPAVPEKASQPPGRAKRSKPVQTKSNSSRSLPSQKTAKPTAH